MFSHRVFRFLGLTVSAVAALNCGDFTRSTSPTQPKQLPPTRIVGASFSLVAGGSVSKAVKWSSSHSLHGYILNAERNCWWDFLSNYGENDCQCVASEAALGAHPVGDQEKTPLDTSR